MKTTVFAAGGIMDANQPQEFSMISKTGRGCAGIFPGAMSLLLSFYLLLSSLPSAAAVTVTDYYIAYGSIGGIAAGPDGYIWITLAGDKIGRGTGVEDMTYYDIPTASSWPKDITAGPDGNLWFTEPATNKIGKVTPDGTVVEFVVTTAASSPHGITPGPDGNLWFTEQNGNKIGRITTSGTITEFDVPTAGSSPNGITAGPDGKLWFTEAYGNKIGRITTSGTITEFNVTTAASSPSGITAGPDGNLWFTEANGNKIGRITTSGAITEFDIPTADASAGTITAASNGNLWFAEPNKLKIGKVSGIDGGPYSAIRLIHGNDVHNYTMFDEAYTAAADGDIIQLQAVDIEGPLNLYEPIDVTLRGGYDSVFVLNTLVTFVEGSMEIGGGSGAVTLDKVGIR